MSRSDPAHDPPSPDWRELELPDGWPDALRPSRPRDLWQLLRKGVLGRVGPVVLPAGIPLNAAIPKYVLQEFHNLPNGNYSRSVTRHYSTAFDLFMLGTMARARRDLAESLRSARSALDLGCGGGHTAGALHDAGIPEVSGLDASPYLLQHAARLHPGLRFVQGLAESTGFPSRRFEAVAACFLFHELPPRAGDAALAEIRRILVPGGLVGIVEPGIEQWIGAPLSLLRRHGPRGLDFRILARFVHEPFVASWHRRDVPAWLAAAGFSLVSQESRFPTQMYVARAC